MAGVTNRGKKRILDICFRAQNVPTYFYLALFTNAAAPSSDVNTVSELTQIAAGNGYTDGGYQLTPGTTDFDYLSEDDTNDLSIIQIKDISWTATGGNIPASGNGARYACLTDDNATIANREIIAYWDLLADRSASVGLDFVLQNLQMNLGE